MTEETVQLEAIEDDLNARLFVPGTPCLVRFAENTFLVRIVEATQETVLVSFHAFDFPVPGMLVEIEFHEPEGVVRYLTKVVKGPTRQGDGILLERSLSPRIIQHRATCRVKANLDVTLVLGAGDSHPGQLKNLSTTGAMLESGLTLASGDRLDIELTLPDATDRHQLESEVCYAGPGLGSGVESSHIYGLRFTGYSPGAGTAVTNYVWQRLKELYPSVSP